MEEALVDIVNSIAIICFMRLFSLFLAFCIVFCYSIGICSASTPITGQAEQKSSHCEMMDHGDAESEDAAQLISSQTQPADMYSSPCCYQALTNASLDDNVGNALQEVLFILDLPTSFNTTKSEYPDLIVAQSSHDPPDIYLSVSSLLL